MDLFLAGVANAVLMDGTEIFADAKTLTESSISISVTGDDIRGGQGNKLFGKFFHDSTFDLTLTDAMFRLEYIAAHVGSEVGLGGDVFWEGKVKATAASLNLEQACGHKAVKMLESHDAIYCWIKESEDKKAAWLKKEVVEGAISGLEANKEYCIRFMFNNSAARSIKVNANFVPKTLTVIMTANLYSGDASNPSTGTKVGYLVIKVPRFLLNGTTDLSMTADGSSTSALEGSALAFGGDNECYGACGVGSGGYYAEIIEAYCDLQWFDVAKEIYFQDAEEGITVAKDESGELVVYAIYDDGSSPVAIPASDLNVASSDVNKVTVNGLSFTAVAVGEADITAKAIGNEKLAASIKVVVTE